MGEDRVSGRLRAMKYRVALLGFLAACTIEAKVPPPVVTIACLELVQGSTPVALDCAKVDAGGDSGGR
jgi:hypothetical protein